MKKYNIKNMIMVGVSLLSALSPLASVFAEEDTSNFSTGFNISPTNQNIVLVPGESHEYSITVGNPQSSLDAVNIHARIVPFSVYQDSTDYSVDYQTVSNYNQIVDWIEIENPDVTVEPNETAVINYTINVPEDAPAGGQYASINVQRVADEKDVGNANIVETMEIASLIYATILGDTDESGEVISNNVHGFSFDSVIRADSLIKNTGNVHQTAKFKLQVFPLIGDEEYYTNEEEPGSIVVIPDQQYYRSQEWEGPTVGVFRVKQTVEIAGEVSEVEKFVIVCPLWLLFVIVAAVIFILIWIFARNKKRKNR